MPSHASFIMLLWRFLRPEIEEFLIYALLIISFIVVAFIDTQSKTTVIGTQDTAFSYLENRLAFITDGGDATAKLFTFGLWFVIGTVVYGAAWFVINFLSGTFKDVEVSSKYVHPRSFDKSGYWAAILGRVILQTSAAIALCIYVIFWCAVFAPAWFGSIKSPFINGLNNDTATYGIIALIGIALSLHVAAILLRVTLLRSRYIYQR